MNKCTTIINKLSNDKIVQIIISDRKYILFTIFNRILIIIDMTNKKRPILLMNRTYTTYDKLIKSANKIRSIASSIDNNDDFILNMDTYFDMNNNLDNDTIEEIMAIYKILLEDYDL